jgi:hypothetical protein
VLAARTSLRSDFALEASAAQRRCSVPCSLRRAPNLSTLSIEKWPVGEVRAASAGRQDGRWEVRPPWLERVRTSTYRGREVLVMERRLPHYIPHASNTG